jgi:prepilin-type processing-associated H-X9-DG protein
MRSAGGWNSDKLITAVVVIVLLAAFAAGILAKEGSPGGKMQPGVRALTSAARLYDTEANRDQCLSSVKNIARAIQMYLADWDKLPPEEHRKDAIDYFSGRDLNIANCPQVTRANPYLRWPVVLDEYIKTRASWDCPSARVSVTRLWIVPGSDWLGYLRKNEAKWGRKAATIGPCVGAWPPGWGGSVTDSIAQDTMASAAGLPDSTGAFRQAVGCAAAPGLSKSQVADPAWFVVCGDSGQEMISSPLTLAYPDVCKLANHIDDACGADWQNCPQTQSCGLSAAAYKRFWEDAGVRKSYTRHLGGSNVGFLDGHASWMLSEDIIANSPDSKDNSKGKMRGVGCVCRGLREG